MKDDSSSHLNPPDNAVVRHMVTVMLEHGTPFIWVDIEGVRRSLILDTGSNISILQPGVSKSDISVTTVKPYGVTGEALEIRGQQSVTVKFSGREFSHNFFVCSLPTEAAGLLGMDFLRGSGAKIDFERCNMSLTDVGRMPHTYAETLTGHTALTVFAKDKEGHSSQSKQKEARRKDEQFPASPHLEVTASQSITWLVKAKQNVTIAPRCRQIVIGELENEREQELPQLVCVEPVQIPIEGIFPARALTRVNVSVGQSASVTSQREQAETRPPNSCAYVMIANFSDEPLTIPKSTVLGIAEEISETVVNKINPPGESDAKLPIKPPRKGKNEALYRRLLRGKLDHLSLEDRQQIEPILVKYAHTFHDEETNDFMGTNVVEHEILLTDPRPIRRPPYRTPYALRDEMQSQVQKMLDKGVIRPSNSPWSAPALLVPKKSADGKPKYRFCVDFRALNAVTKFDSYPLPVIDETTAGLHGSKYFTVLDCFSGFWQVNIKEEHRERTGFTVPSGHYEFNRLPFGMSNSPANFQRLMDTVLKNLVGTECFVYIDDIVIFSSTAEEHALRLENVLRRFDQANLQLHPGKCVFAQPRVQYLGFVLSEDGISASPDKIKAVKDYPVPQNVKDVRAFLGLSSFYRRLVPNFADIAKPLTTLTRKDQKFVWGPSQQQAFQSMKDKLCTTPVLAYPNFKLPFILATDASGVGVAAILSQVQNGQERVIAYASRQLNSAEQAYSASEAEMLALVWATKHFRCYLLGRKFLVRTDHRALTYLRNFADQNSRLMRWSLKLSELDFSVEHRAGSRIAHVDALSRHVGAVLHRSSLSRENILNEQSKDAFCIEQSPGTYSSRNEFFLDDSGILYRRQFKGKHQLVVPKALIQDVIKENHVPQYVAHPGVRRTYNLISLNYWWPGMRKSIQEYVRSCDPCQRRKEDREFVAPLGEVDEPKTPFAVTSMDITGPYLKTPQGNKYLLTFICHLTKYVEAFPIPDQTAETCARVYATQIVTRHGAGSKLITDQGRAFMSKFFQETCKILGIRSVHTTSFHPQSNAQIERWHRSLHVGLSHYVNSTHTNWDTLVPFFLMAYRATPNTVTGYSPFFLLHGREMTLPSRENLKPQLPKENFTPDQRLENLKSSLRTAYSLAAKANKKSHSKNKRLYDRKAKMREFRVKDLVYLYYPARKPGLTKKFHLPWSGPFQITRKISDLNYEIADQDNKTQIVHSNRLKLCYDSKLWKQKASSITVKKPRRKQTRQQSEDPENDFPIGSFPLVNTDCLENTIEHETPLDQILDTPEPNQHIDTPISDRTDPAYFPPDTPRSRRELQTLRTDPPVTRSRSRVLSQESTVTNNV